MISSSFEGGFPAPAGPISSSPTQPGAGLVVRTTLGAGCLMNSALAMAAGEVHLGLQRYDYI